MRHVVRVTNMVPSRALGKGVTPHHLFVGLPPDLSGERVIGCAVYVHEERYTGSLGSRAKVGVNLGRCQDSPGWHVAVNGKVRVSRNVVFDEDRTGVGVLGLKESEHARACSWSPPMSKPSHVMLPSCRSPCRSPLPLHGQFVGCVVLCCVVLACGWVGSPA